MKPKKNRLQLRVLRRLESGQPPTRWQQFMLHLLTMARQLRRRRFSSLWFHGKGLLRIVWKPFTVCRLFGVPVQFHVTWFIYPAGFLFWLLFDYNRPWKMYYVLLMLLVICASLLAHEFAHVLTARRFGIGTRHVVFIPLGAVAILETNLRLPNEFWIALAGPVTSLVVAGMFWGSFHLLACWHASWKFIWLYHWMRAWQFGFELNLMIAGFNLLPCYPMDGGRMLRSSLAVIIGRYFPRPFEQTYIIATRIAVRYVAWPVALGMMVYAVCQWEDYWMYLILFPLLLFVAEIEYAIVRENASKTDSDGNAQNVA